MGWEFLRENHETTYYSVMRSSSDEESLGLLRQLFTEPIDFSLNFLLLSTSGVHGSYATIEDCEAELRETGVIESDITFLVVQPRIVGLRYGNCKPRTQEDLDWLKSIREKSRKAMVEIGS